MEKIYKYNPIQNNLNKITYNTSKAKTKWESYPTKNPNRKKIH